MAGRLQLRAEKLTLPPVARIADLLAWLGDGTDQWDDADLLGVTRYLLHNKHFRWD